MAPQVRLGALDRLVLALVALVLAGGLGWQNGIGRVDNLIYDTFLAASPGPAAKQVVVVAIDEASLAAIGRWPWPRRVHADLIERISAYDPRAIGLDLLLSEADTAAPKNDALLAAAMQRSGKVVLPVFMASPTGAGFQAMPPVPQLAQSAAALGHVAIELDRDGIARSVFLRAGEAGRLLPHFAVSLMEVAGLVPAGATLPGERDPHPGGGAAGDGIWYRDNWVPIWYAGPPGTYETISAVDVLQGRADGERFRDGIVLIGPTAIGLGDVYPTPVSGLSVLMPGAEITANVIGNLAADWAAPDRAGVGGLLKFATPLQNALLSLFPVMVLLAGLHLLAPQRALALVVSLVALSLLGSWMGLRYAGYWFAPAGTLTVLILLYALWNWRRLETAIRYLRDEVRRLHDSDPLWPMPVTRPGGDLLDRQIDSLGLAAAHLRFLHHFISTTIASLPDVTLVADQAGHILMVNRAAVAYFRDDHLGELRGIDLVELLAGMSSPHGGSLLDVEAGIPGAASYRTALDRALSAIEPEGRECRDGQGRDFLLKTAQCHDDQARFTVWVLSLVEITALRQAERERDEALRFLSHDMRAPQAAIVSLLEMYQEGSANLEVSAVLQRIREHVGRTQSLAESFIQLARAESSTLNLTEVDYADILMDASDACWEFARSRRIHIELALPDDPAPATADPVMLTRACINLIHNAIKYSAPETTVWCAVRAMPGGGWILSIRDEGRGIDPADHGRVFERFARFGDVHSADAPSGVGLGLAFTRMAVERHGGHIEFDSEPGVGTEFRIVLPASG